MAKSLFLISPPAQGRIGEPTHVREIHGEA